MNVFLYLKGRQERNLQRFTDP